ncbi:hypothetical protein D0864_02255 [Hortaea werneckii]|uniref:Uncharacterized protein n=1 Tax=Hortaea werneckii TaxID=91943 RepID=A0A3M7GZY0_HORWE|nr:hypothetical protein D0864_02255 [Hortaea werneckii]
MLFDITDDLKPDQPRQLLETILTVWIEMIQSQKVVALPDTVDRDAFEEHPEGGFRLIPGLDRDPETGARPLEDAPLRLWDGIVVRIERLIGLDSSEDLPALSGSDALSALSFPKGFATRFLSWARRPRFTYFAPGLRVPTEQEIQSPTAPSSSNRRLGQRSGTLLAPRFRARHRAIRPVSCGFYLTPCDRAYCCPQENGCNLVLTGKASSGWAQKADLRPVEIYDDLLQPGVNTFDDLHPISFPAFLENVRFQKEQLRWAVDSEGVASGLKKWCEGDTEERWMDYVTNVGHQGYW